MVLAGSQLIFYRWAKVFDLINPSAFVVSVLFHQIGQGGRVAYLRGGPNSRISVLENIFCYVSTVYSTLFLLFN